MNNTQMNSPTPPSAESRFFAWVRDSGLERSERRWIAGVAGGLARRLGWDVVLVRVLMVASVLCFGFGIALYGLLWFVIPDRRNNTILLEELIAGRWDWSCIGVFLCIAVALIFPGAGFFVIALSCLAAFLLMQWGRNAAASSANPQSGQMPHEAGGQQRSAGHGQATYSQAGPSPASPSSPAAPFQSAPAQSAPFQSPQTPYTAAPSPAAPSPAMPFSAAPSQGRQDSTPETAWSAQGNGYAARPGSPAAHYADQRYQYRYQARTIYARRRPAGPVVVSAVLGLLLVSAAVMLILVVTGNMNAVETLRFSTLWAGVSVIVLGGVLVLLGCFGRRSGGLTPIAILALLLTLSLLGLSGAYGYVSVLSDRNTRGFDHVSVLSDISMGSTPSDMQRYSRGIILDGSDATSAGSKAETTIDLREYEQNNGKHTVVSDDGSKVETSCPTGTIRFTLLQTKAAIIMPQSCAYSLNDYGSETPVRISMGGSFVRVGGSGVMTLNEWSAFADSSNATPLENTGDTQRLHIEIPAMVGGEVSVDYVK